ncbi:MAG: hypothetical protein Q8L27_00175 [archaeon]|nr:hypothetical protein [archaeon]
MNKKKNLRVMAFAQIFSLVLEIFAFTFIFGISLGGVSAYNDGDVLQAKDTAGKVTYTYTRTNGEWIAIGQPSRTDTDIEDYIKNYDATRYSYTPTTTQSSKNPSPSAAPAGASHESGGTLLGGRTVGDNVQTLTLNQDFELKNSEGNVVYNAKKGQTAKITKVGENYLINGEKKITKAEYEQLIAAGTLSGTTKKYSFFGADASGAGVVGGNLLEGLYWASLSWGLVQTLGAMGIVPQNMAQSLGTALFAGITVGKIVQIGADKGVYSGGYSVAAGILVAYITFASQYKDTKTHEETIEFKCLAWQAPIVADKSERAKDCNTCNTDPLKPCSEYRCKSLGQSCKLINEGTALMKCIDGSIDDVNSPGIKPFEEVLTNGYTYENVRNRPAGKGTGQVSGMTIANNGGCLKSWTPFDFGIITFDKLGQNQPAQCKMDFNHTTSFEDMGYWMGGSNLFIENHSQRISLPGTATLNSEFPEIENDGEYKLYVRCRNGNGNNNEDEFVVNFCIDKTPDLTAPVISAATPTKDSPVLYKIDNVTTSIYTNEPSNCKWARKDSSYENMENSFACSNQVWNMNAESLYTCTTTLTAIQDKVENKFYFKCRDLSPQNNTMADSYEYSLFGTQPLTILSVSPTGIIGSATSTGSVNLEIKTDNGFHNGESTCSYSTTKEEGTYVNMFDSGNKNIHSQPLDLIGGTYTYYFKCVDLGGNTVYNQTTFVVYIDKYAPEVVRVYNLESKIKLLTNENAICKYSTTSCNFDLNKEGIISMPFDSTKEHWAEWKTDQTYYIKCMDEFNNQPNPESCSIIVRPYELAKQE